jgi:hypothetical protein
MKKVVIQIALTILTSLTRAQESVNIKIYFKTMKCEKASTGEGLNTDGKGDEVYLFGAAYVMNQNADIVKKNFSQTPTYGDATGRPGRVHTGSAVDLFGNNKGGIKDGDEVNLNLHVASVSVNKGAYFVFIPSVWESDENPFSFNKYLNALENPQFETRKAIWNLCEKNITNSIGTLPLNTGLFPVNVGGSAVSGPISEITLNGSVNGDRPVGLGHSNPTGFIGPNMKFHFKGEQAFTFSWNNLSYLCNKDFGSGKGVIESWMGNDEHEMATWSYADQASYWCLIRMEFTPVYSAAPPPTTLPGSTPAPPPTTQPANSSVTTMSTGTINKNKTIGQTTAINGMWKGTFGSGSNNGPNYYSFQLNTDGTMQVLDGAGKSIANGTYTFSNNQLNGFYKYNGALSGFSFAATLSGTQLNGTWGSGNNVTGGGRWVMNKAGVAAATNIR